MTDLAAIEARIWSLLEPYRSDLEDATIYGMPSLRWPGAKAHEDFAAVKPAAKHIGLYLLPVEKHPDALEGTPDALLRRQTGKVTFTFRDLDDAMADDLAALLHRLYERYRADHAGR